MMPEHYASNLGMLENMNEGKFIGMKNYDCNVFMKTLMPIALPFYQKGYANQSET